MLADPFDPFDPFDPEARRLREKLVDRLKAPSDPGRLRDEYAYFGRVPEPDRRPDGQAVRDRPNRPSA